MCIPGNKGNKLVWPCDTACQGEAYGFETLLQQKSYIWETFVWETFGEPSFCLVL